MEQSKTRLTARQQFFVATMLFGMFFGAGNLIFPIYMGHLAGRNMWSAVAGFLVTGVGLPLLGVAALVYLLPVIGFLLGYFLSVGLAEGTRYIIAIAAAAVSFMPSVFYDRYAKRHEVLTYTIVRLF